MAGPGTGSWAGDLTPLRRGLSLVLLGAVFLFLAAGNLPRLVSLPGSRNPVLITEFLVYGLAPIAFLVAYPLRRYVLAWWPVWVLVVASYAVGLLKHGVETLPFLYTVRLLLLLFSSVAVGALLFAHFGTRIRRVFDFLLAAYLVTAVLGTIIFVLFPRAADFWALMRLYGIEWEGDPHRRRFVSPLLDPNFYAAVACLPLIISLVAHRFFGRIRYLALAGGIAVTIVLAGSRSGTATLLLVGGLWLVLVAAETFVRRRVSIAFFLAAPPALVLLLAASPLYAEALVRTWARIANMGQDPSALMRVQSFRLGWELFWADAVLGTGYNYLAIQTLASRGLASLDSSVQSTFINFGAVGSIVLLVLFMRAVWNGLVQAGGEAKRTPEGVLMKLLAGYVAVVILFTSQFNNVLYYQFWVFPTVALWTYLVILGDWKAGGTGSAGSRNDVEARAAPARPREI